MANNKFSVGESVASSMNEIMGSSEHRSIFSKPSFEVTAAAKKKDEDSKKKCKCAPACKCPGSKGGKCKCKKHMKKKALEELIGVIAKLSEDLDEYDLVKSAAAALNTLETLIVEATDESGDEEDKSDADDKDAKDEDSSDVSFAKDKKDKDDKKDDKKEDKKDDKDEDKKKDKKEDKKDKDDDKDDDENDVADEVSGSEEAPTVTTTEKTTTTTSAPPSDDSKADDVDPGSSIEVGVTSETMSDYNSDDDGEGVRSLMSELGMDSSDADDASDEEDESDADDKDDECMGADDDMLAVTAAAKGKKKVKNKGSSGDVVFPANSSKVKDDKDHFPIKSESQARNALARANQYKKAPPWYKGSLEELVNAVARAVKRKYKGIEVSKKSTKPGKG